MNTHSPGVQHADVLTCFSIYIKSIHNAIFIFSLTVSVFRFQIQVMYCRKKDKEGNTEN